MNEVLAVTVSRTPIASDGRGRRIESPGHLTSHQSDPPPPEPSEETVGGLPIPDGPGDPDVGSVPRGALFDEFKEPNR